MHIKTDLKVQEMHKLICDQAITDCAAAGIDSQAIFTILYRLAYEVCWLVGLLMCWFVAIAMNECMSE